METWHSWQEYYFIIVLKLEICPVLSTMHIVLSTFMCLQTLTYFQTDYLQFLLTFPCEPDLLDMIIFPHLSYLHIFLGEHFSKYKRVFTNSLNNQTITSCISQAKPIHTFQMFAFFKHHHCFGKTVGYWLVVSSWEVTMVRSLFSAFLVAPRYGFEHSTGPAWIWWFALDLVELHPTFQAVFLILQCHFAFYSLIFTCSASQFWEVCRFHTHVSSSILRSKNENV